jgi:hypothetical protein
VIKLWKTDNYSRQFLKQHLPNAFKWRWKLASLRNKYNKQSDDDSVVSIGVETILLCSLRHKRPKPVQILSGETVNARHIQTDRIKECYGRHDEVVGFREGEDTFSPCVAESLYQHRELSSHAGRNNFNNYNGNHDTPLSKDTYIFLPPQLQPGECWTESSIHLGLRSALNSASASQAEILDSGNSWAAHHEGKRRQEL